MRMLKTGGVLIALALAMGVANSAAADDDPLKVYERLIGTWKGASTGAGTKGQDDIVTWEYILGGKAVQSTHSINDGAYGGRTIYFYSKADNRHFYHYFTNAGFHSTGTLKFDGDQVTAEETVLGFPGLTDVKATIRFTDAGWETASTYLQNGEWVQGDGFRYTAAPDATVIFRSAD